MKYLVFFTFSFLVFQIGVCQNLISNPSFEDIDSCYGDVSQLGFDVFKWTGCKNWTCPIASSSDLWCENGVAGFQNPPEIVGVGFQEPRTGNIMAGILLNGGTIISYREFVQNKIESSLEKDGVYKLSFYHSPIYVDCSINQFGVYAIENEMDNDAVYQLANVNPNGISELDTFKGDTSLWNLCEITFKAKGGENFIIVGNFQDSTNATYAEPCDTTFWNGLHYAGNYFFLDDFNLEKLSLEVEIPNVFTPNNDDVNDVFVPFVPNISSWKLTIFNRWGNEIKTLHEADNQWNGHGFSEGVYFYKFQSSNVLKHGYFQLIR